MSVYDYCRSHGNFASNDGKCPDCHRPVSPPAAPSEARAEAERLHYIYCGSAGCDSDRTKASSRDGWCGFFDALLAALLAAGKRERVKALEEPSDAEKAYDELWFNPPGETGRDWFMAGYAASAARYRELIEEADELVKAITQVCGQMCEAWKPYGRHAPDCMVPEISPALLARLSDAVGK